MKANKYIIAALAITILISCKKKKGEEVPDWVSAEDQSIANALWQDIYKQVDEEAQGSSVANRSCATVTLNPTTGFPTTMSIDFGLIGCMGIDGRYRKGKIDAVFTGPWRDSLTTVTVTTTNYYVDGYDIIGTKVIENKGHIGSFLTYDVAVSNAVITDQSNNSFTWSSDVRYTWIEGESTTFITHGTAGILDDVYLIDGNYSGVNRQGNSFTAITSTPVKKKLNCKWPVSGVLELTPQGLETRVIDFGSGACDNDASVTVGSYSTVVQMR